MRRAVTLVEVLVVGGVLGLVLAMVGKALVMGYRVHKKSIDGTAHYREATLALSRMLREISTCVLWVEPPTGTGPFTPDVTNRMRFFRADETTGVALFSGPGPVGKEVAYWVDHTNHELRRLDPDHPWGYRVVVRDLDSFTVDVVDPNVTLVLKVRGNHQSLQITARAARM